MRNRIGFRARMPICAVILAAILLSFPSLASAETEGLSDQPPAENTAQGSVDAMTDDAAESNAEHTSPLNAGAIEDASVTEVQKQISWTQAGSCEWGGR